MLDHGIRAERIERRGSKLSKRLPATGIIFRETKAENTVDWHTAPRRQYIVNLESGVKITASDAAHRPFDTNQPSHHIACNIEPAQQQPDGEGNKSRSHQYHLAIDHQGAGTRGGVGNLTFCRCNTTLDRLATP